MIRAATQMTPDQAHDPRGIGPVIWRFNGVMSLSAVDGAQAFGRFNDHSQPSTGLAKAAGNVAGGFATPKHSF